MSRLMTNEYQVLATPVFKITLRKLEAFLSRKYSNELAKKTKRSIKDKISIMLTSNPHIAPQSERLLELGVTDYHQLTVDKQNIIDFRIDEQQKTVVLIAVMDSRQDLQKLLFEVSIEF